MSTSDVNTDKIHFSQGVFATVLTPDQFFYQVSRSTVLIVKNQEEYDYWNGIQLIVGREFRVVHKNDLSRLLDQDPHFHMSHTLYRTFDNIMNMVKFPLP